jgi:hypothetical protein
VTRELRGPVIVETRSAEVIEVARHGRSPIRSSHVAIEAPG